MTEEKRRGRPHDTSKWMREQSWAWVRGTDIYLRMTHLKKNSNDENDPLVAGYEQVCGYDEDTTQKVKYLRSQLEQCHTVDINYPPLKFQPD